MSSPEFTGERFIPGQGGAQIAYEHLHRYRFALHWAIGKDVLDVATGVGYGAGLLAQAAQRVWAVDLDAASVQYARKTCGAHNILFLQGDAAWLPVRSGAADLAVALEVLEHVENQEGLVAELARAVKPGGTVLISTPNKSSYSEARNYHNPFHVRELYRDEFLALLQRHFGSIQLVEQHVRAGSLILNPEPAACGSEVIAEPFNGLPVADATYFLALCRVGGERHVVPAASACLDTADGYLREWEARLQSAGAELEKLNREIEQLGSWGRELQDRVSDKDLAILELQGELARLREDFDERGRWTETLQAGIAARDASLLQMKEELDRVRTEFDERGRWAQHLDQEVADRDATIRSTQAELDLTATHLARIRGKRMYRILRRLGLLPD